MWNIEQLETRIKELAAQIEQSAANHHILLGSKMTYESLLGELKKGAEVVAAIDPALANDCANVEKVADIAETVVEAIPESTAS